MANYKNMHNEELLDLLFTEEDMVPRAAADEIVRRGDETFPMLAEIVMDRILWTVDLPEWWAPVHATYLIGAIGGEAATLPLLASLRWSDAYENEWVSEDLPSILGSLGERILPLLISAARDIVSGWSARSIAMDAMAALAIRNPRKEEEVMEVLAKILRDRHEDFGARRSAAFVLLDFKRLDCKKALIAIAKEEEKRKQQFPDYRVAFTVEDIERDLRTSQPNIDNYARDWMSFYNPEDIHKRQERWEGEDRRERGENFPTMPPHINRQDIFIDHKAPCPCGSGKLYKNCCWRKLH